MDSSRAAMQLVLILLLSTIALAGCANFDLSGGPSSWRFPWDEKPDVVPGITSPAERINTLRKMREKAAWAGREELERISGELAEAIRDEADPLIRAEIVHTLGEYPTAASARVLTAALQDSDGEVRIAACDALGRHGGEEAAQALGATLSGDVDLDVRLAAARALGKTDDEKAVAALGIALEDQDPAMQHRAVASLRKLTGEDFGGDVESWRQYVKGEHPKPDKPISVAERLRRIF